MPKIMLNSVEYTGGGGDSGMELTYDEYIALPEEEKTNGTTYYVKDINGVGKDQFQPIIYSEEEREIGVWTDGKPLYQRTFDVRSVTLNNNNWTDNILGTSNISIKSFDGIAFVNGIPYCNYAYYRATNEFLSAAIPSTGTDLSIICRIDGVTVTAGIVTIQYTKSSDAVGSGTWTPQGVPAHHYSTSEQVVGTWVDNKPLYEKTVYFVNTRSSFSDFVSVEQIPNIDTTVCIEFTCVRDLGAQFGYLQITGSGSTKPEALSANYGIAFRTNGDYLQYRIDGYGTQVTDCYATVRYTKTT